MPRFENEGYNPNKRRDVDRTVPEDENYYGNASVDLNFNNKENVVSDNQRRGINPCDDTQENNGEVRFRSESSSDYKPQSRKANNKKSPPNNKNGGKKKKRKRKKPKAVTIIIAVIVIILLILAGVFAVIMNRINYDDKTEGYVASSELESSSSVKNILLLGVDARSGDDDESSRSDTMMLISLDSKHHCIKITSFLRDSWVYIPSLGYEQRLNAACSSGGYQGVVDAIEYNYGVDIDGYAVVDFEMFEVLVDSIGGVEVTVTEAEAAEVTNHQTRYGGVTLESGTYTLTGEQALAYCRIRKIDTDFARTQRQRTVMTAIISSAKSSNPFKLISMAYNSAPYLETDLTKGEIISLMFKALWCVSGDIVQMSVPFDGTWEYATISGNSVISLNVSENRETLIDYIYNKTAEEIEAEIGGE